MSSEDDELMHSSEDDSTQEQESSGCSSENEERPTCKRRTVEHASSHGNGIRGPARTARQSRRPAGDASKCLEAPPPGGRRIVLTAGPSGKRRCSGSSVQTMTQLKMPVPNYQRPVKAPSMTLGARKPYAHLTALLGSTTRHITNPDGQGAQVCDGQPLLIYNPAVDEDETRRTNYKPVYVAADLAAKLRPHQKEGVAFMFTCLAGLRKGGFQGAILMDGMGLGKTFQSICTLWTLLTTGVEGQPTCSRPLILCPSSLVMNWSNELKRWLGADRVDPVALDDTRGAIVKDALFKVWGTGARGLKGMEAVKAGGGAQRPQVLVMSYTTFRKHKEALYRMKVDLVVCDEAHCLKNGDAQLTQAVSGLSGARRLLLSGTPVQNDLSEFFTLFNVAVPGLLGEAAQFRKTYELPIQRGQDADATERDVAVGLERSQQMLVVCGQYMLRRTCGVMAQYLPPKVEQVVFCRMSPLQVKLYQHFYNSAPVQRLLRGGRAAEIREEKAAAATAAATATATATATVTTTADTTAAAVAQAPMDITFIHSASMQRQPAQAQGAAGKPAGTSNKASGRVLADITNTAPASKQQKLSSTAGRKSAGSKAVHVPGFHHVVSTTSIDADGLHGGQLQGGVGGTQTVPKTSGSHQIQHGNHARGHSASDGNDGHHGVLAGDGDGQVMGQGSGRASGSCRGGVSGKATRTRENELSVLAAITAVKKLCCHPDLIYDMLAPPKASLCRLATSSGRVIPTRASGGHSAASTATAALNDMGCNASGHVEGYKAAVVTGFEGSLPLFRDPGLPSAYTPHKCEPVHSGKVLVLVHLLKSIRANEPTDKVVLVSNYTEALDMLEKLCAEQKWPWLRLDGSLSVKQRQPLVDQFNDSTHPSFLFLLSSKAGGVGLNIIGANRLILFDPDWNPANDLQAMARVWREGQKKKVWIYRMLTTGSLEEKVYQRQLMKQGLSKSVVDDSGNQSRQFSTEELRALFKVDPTVTCDTHAAIKCKCDGSKATLEAKLAVAHAKAMKQQEERDTTTDQAEGAATDKEKPPEEVGVIDWAHLSDVSQSPDAVWQHVPPFVRQRFVTYLFSDHTTNQKPQLAKCQQSVQDEDQGEVEEEQGEDVVAEGSCQHGDDDGW